MPCMGRMIDHLLARLKGSDHGSLSSLIREGNGYDCITTHSGPSSSYSVGILMNLVFEQNCLVPRLEQDIPLRVGGKIRSRQRLLFSQHACSPPSSLDLVIPRYSYAKPVSLLSSYLSGKSFLYEIRESFKEFLCAKNEQNSRI